MPELSTERQRIEAEFRERLSRVHRKWRPILIEALGEPPDPRNIPEELWRQVERDRNDHAYWIILLGFLVAHDNLRDQFLTPGDHPPLPLPGLRRRAEGVSPHDEIHAAARGELRLPPAADAPVGDFARAWAAAESRRLAHGMGATDRRALGLPPTIVTPSDSTATPVQAPAAPQIDLPRFAEILAGQFDDDRAETVAATETTGAIVAGERTLAWQLESRGWGFEKIWHTERDDRVCPICTPLDGTPESHYGPIVGAPPSHVGCRCWETYRRIL